MTSIFFWVMCLKNLIILLAVFGIVIVRFERGEFIRRMGNWPVESRDRIDCSFLVAGSLSRLPLPALS